MHSSASRGLFPQRHTHFHPLAPEVSQTHRASRPADSRAQRVRHLFRVERHAEPERVGRRSPSAGILSHTIATARSVLRPHLTLSHPTRATTSLFVLAFACTVAWAHCGAVCRGRQPRRQRLDLNRELVGVPPSLRRAYVQQTGNGSLTSIRLCRHACARMRAHTRGHTRRAHFFHYCVAPPCVARPCVLVCGRRLLGC